MRSLTIKVRSVDAVELYVPGVDWSLEEGRFPSVVHFANFGLNGVRVLVKVANTALRLC